MKPELQALILLARQALDSKGADGRRYQRAIRAARLVWLAAEKNQGNPPSGMKKSEKERLQISGNVHDFPASL